eukprot:6486746-Amphidinium_carterae.1
MRKNLWGSRAHGRQEQLCRIGESMERSRNEHPPPTWREQPVGCLAAFLSAPGLMQRARETPPAVLIKRAEGQENTRAPGIWKGHTWPNL